jgi:hypothetical protein
VQGGVGEDGVDRLGQAEGVPVGQQHAVVAEPAPGRRDHGRVAVQGQHRGPGGGDRGRQLAGAAAQVEHDLPRPRVEQLDEVAGQAGDEAELPLVAVGVPPARHLGPP